MSEQLAFEVTTERRQGLTRDLPAGHDEWRWVANTATLIYGDRDAVLVDTFTTVEQNERLIRWVQNHDKQLTHVYLTHGHGDHAFGVGQLMAAFPGVKAVASAGTVAEVALQAQPEFRDDFWGRLFPGQIPEVTLPEVLDSDSFELEGEELRVIEAGHTDTEGTTSLWIPSIRLVVAGDVVYNATYPYLAETTAESRPQWMNALERLGALNPENVVSGHKQPQLPDLPADIDATIRYLTDVSEVEATTSTASEFYEAMLTRQPNRANVGSLWGTAKLLKGAPTLVQTA
jgi:glyoxylase-like metal-dependent hydrolase (beta-lactamase superfamily II)